jgi:hypothetical protein
MVTSVPWQLRSSDRVVQREQIAPGAVRWGMHTRPAGTTGRHAPADGATASGTAAITSPQRSVDRP